MDLGGSSDDALRGEDDTSEILSDATGDTTPLLIKTLVDSYMGGGVFQWDLIVCKDISVYMLAYHTRRFTINLVIVTFKLRKKVYSCSINGANTPRSAPEFTSIVLQRAASEALRHFIITCRSMTSINIEVSPRLKKQVKRHVTTLIHRADTMAPRARSYSV